jgi:hypothetical protein
MHGQRGAIMRTSSRWRADHCMEAETHLMIAVRLEYIAEDEASLAFALVTDIRKMLTTLWGKLTA